MPLVRKHEATLHSPCSSSICTLLAGQAISYSEDTNFKDISPTLIQPNVKPKKCQHLHSKAKILFSKKMNLHGYSYLKASSAILTSRSQIQGYASLTVSKQYLLIRLFFHIHVITTFVYPYTSPPQANNYNEGSTSNTLTNYEKCYKTKGQIEACGQASRD